MDLIFNINKIRLIVIRYFAWQLKALRVITLFVLEYPWRDNFAIGIKPYFFSCKYRVKIINKVKTFYYNESLITVEIKFWYIHGRLKYKSYFARPTTNIVKNITEGFHFFKASLRKVNLKSVNVEFARRIIAQKRVMHKIFICHKTFLTNITHQNETISRKVIIIYRVPQGTVAGPLFFNDQNRRKK